MPVIIDDHSPEVLAALKNAIERGLWAIGDAAEEHAKDNLKNFPRVDTGRLLNSVTHAEDGKATYVGTNVEYGIYVELGTGKFASKGTGRKDPWVYKGSDGKWHYTHGMKPSHFLKKAASEHKEEYQQLMKESLENA